MNQYKLSDISLKDIRNIVQFHEKEMAVFDWTNVDTVSISDEERRQIADICSRIFHYKVSLMNEATIWARAIYPLLLLSERGNIMAWSQIPFNVQFPKFELQGVVDGVIGKSVSGVLETPYIIVVEAKRALEAKSPQAQLYAEVLAAGKLNWEQDGQPTQEMFGCYTISDNWTFVRAEITEIDSELPKLSIESSREYSEKIEAETIFKILKSIIERIQNKQY